MNGRISRWVKENEYVMESFRDLMKVSKHGVNEQKQNHLYNGLEVVNNLITSSYMYKHRLGDKLCFSREFFHKYFSEQIRKDASGDCSWFNRFAFKVHRFNNKGVGKSYSDLWDINPQFEGAILEIKTAIQNRGYEEIQLIRSKNKILNYRKVKTDKLQQPLNTVNIPFTLNHRNLDIDVIIAKNARYSEYDIINQYYRTVNSGRLCSTGFGLQYMNKVLRNQFCKGYWSYDVEACAPNILAQVYANITGQSLKYLEHYRFNRSEVRQQIAIAVFNRACDKAINFIKGLFNRLFFGGRLNPKDIELIQELMLSFQVTKSYAISLIYAVINNELYKGIARDITTVFNALNNKYGDAIKYGDTKNQKMAYFYQNKERRVLDSMKEAVGDSLQLPLHDGMIIKEFVDPQEIEYLIHKDTEFQLKLEYERVA